MRQVYMVLSVFAFVLSFALLIVQHANRNIHRANPPFRFDPDAPPGKRFKPGLSQPD